MWQKMEYVCVDQQLEPEAPRLLQKRRASYKIFRNICLLADVPVCCLHLYSTWFCCNSLILTQLVFLILFHCSLSIRRTLRYQLHQNQIQNFRQHKAICAIQITQKLSWQTIKPVIDWIPDILTSSLVLWISIKWTVVTLIHICKPPFVSEDHEWKWKLSSQMAGSFEAFFTI